MPQQIIALLLFGVVLILVFTISSEQPGQASIWTMLKNWFSALNRIFALNLKLEKCVNSCGDNTCQSNFCAGKNCSCLETYANCPTDCSNTPTLQPQPTSVENSDQQNDACVNKCPDGLCEEIVCLGADCPCAETPSSCPQDCKNVTPLKLIAPNR